jgi:hypothetical protein
MHKKTQWTPTIYRADALYFDKDLENVDEENVRSFLNRSPDEEIHGSYPLSTAQVRELQKMLHLSRAVSEEDAAFLEGYAAD